MIALLVGVILGDTRAAAEPGRSLDVGGARLYVEECGAGAPIDVVLLHDGLLHSVTWDEVWQPLCSRYHVVRYDRRGYGHSDPAIAPFVPEDDLLRVMREAKMARAILVGNSSGAGLALDFALAHPAMVEGLFLIGPVVHGMPSSAYFLERGNRAQASWSEDRFLLAGPRPDARKKIATVLAENPQNLKTGGQFEIRPSPPTVLRLAEIQAPALLLVGEADIADVMAYAGAIEAALPIVLFEVWKDAGHLIQLEHPAELAQRFDKFAALAHRPEVTVARAVLRAYAGGYKFGERRITISYRKGRLALRLPDQPDKPLFAAGPSRFFVRSTTTELEFERDARGAVNELVIHNADGNTINCPRA